jgi:hypothetical protein
MAIAIAILLMLSMSASMMLIPNASAHTPAWQIPTYAFINVAPNPAGLGQAVTVGFWINIPAPTATGVWGDRWGNMTVKVTKPDGTTETLGTFTADDTGGTSTHYIPTALGNYTFQMSFPGQTLAGNNLQPGTTSAFIGDYYQPATSPVATLTVQQTATPSIPENPLPTKYWTRPIESVNHYWSSISGNWLGLGAIVTFAATGLYNASGNYNPYTTAPTTSHILWTKPLGAGGLLGAEFGSTDTSIFMSDSVYEPKFAPIIINGVLYYEQYPGSGQDPTGFTAVDLRTGQTLWTNNPPAGNTTTILKCGQILDYVSPNQYGALAYLWTAGTPPQLSTDLIITATSISATGVSYTTALRTNTLTGTTFNMYDYNTGNYILSIVNGTTMTMTEDQSGDLIGYYVNSSTANAYNAPTLNMWNSTQCIEYPNGQPPTSSAWEWRPALNCLIPFSNGIMWSMPIATNISGVPLPATLGLPIAYTGAGMNGGMDHGVILMTAAGSGGTGFQTGFQIEAGYSSTTGQQLWITNRTETPYTRLTIGPATAGVYEEVNMATGAMIGYSITTGAQQWTTQLTGANGGPPNPYDSSGGYYPQVGNGVLYLNGFGGDIWAINMTTGAILWYTNTNTISGPAGSNTPYGVWPIWSFGNPGAIADGMLFLSEGHEYSPPLFPGAQEIVLNITNGQPVWNIMGFNVNGGTAISDGIMTTLNSYDNQIYAYGMGPSKTTVTAPDPVTSVGSPMVILGTVTDISAGSQQNAVAMNFPNGLPCVSDASMTQWMEYVYMQQPMPTNATGVPVTLSVIDSNGNYRQIGTTTTNSMGTFGFTWTPDIQGNYTVTATFPGSNSYYGSSADTYFYASAPPATSAPTAAPVTGLATMSGLTIGIAASVIAIIIAIAIVGLLLLRKKP